MASGCDHIAHVRTQMPYAIGIGVLGMLPGDIPTAYGLSMDFHCDRERCYFRLCLVVREKSQGLRANK